MAKRDIYARVEPEYLTICNMTVKTVVIIFVLIEMLLTAIACGCCFWFGYFDVGALCVALLVWLIFVLFGTIIGYQWALIPFEVLHCIAVLALLMAMFGLISLTICPYLHQKWIDFLEDLTIEKSLWFSEIQLENYSRISFGICAGIFVLLISIMVTLISMGYRAYHYLGHYIDEDSPTFESLLDRAVIEAYNRRQRKTNESENQEVSSRHEESSYMPSEAMFTSNASESVTDVPPSRSPPPTQNKSRRSTYRQTPP